MTTELETPYRAPALAERMTGAARAFLASLSDEQRRAAQFPFFGDERYLWNYRPMENMPRHGLWLMAMTKDQQKAAIALMETGVSTRAFDQVKRIMAREATLREHERVEGLVRAPLRDPELYWWSVFGEPGGSEPWGWRVGGHHIGLHFTVVGDQVSPIPLFLGANPAESKMGPDKGDRILPDEEDMARDLVRRLSPEHKAKAIYSPTAPRDIMTDVNRRVWPGLIPRGLAFAGMDQGTRGRLVDLIRLYLTRAQDVLADDAWRRIERVGLDDVTFAWAGPEERVPGQDQGHYYAISGTAFMIEYDNVQNNANHIHSVYREWDGDWGEDILAEHYRHGHGPNGAH